MDSDDEIAYVLSHEIAHIVARHSIKRLQALLGYNLLILLTTGIDSSYKARKALSLAFATIISGYSQEDELTADRLALKYVKKAGFNPLAGITVLEKLYKIEKKEAPHTFSYFRTHPFISQRIKNIKQYLGVPLEFSDILN